MAECKRIMVTVPDSLLNDVDCLAKCDGISRNEMIREAVSEYITGRKNRNLREQLKNGYDAVVDFMLYPKREEYERFLPLYLNNTQHYIYLSSYRVYANEEQPVKETSPRLLDVSTDQVLLSSGDYCIYKAQGEDFLRSSEFDHFTIIRPAIT